MIWYAEKIQKRRERRPGEKHVKVNVRSGARESGALAQGKRSGLRCSSDPILLVAYLDTYPTYV